MNAEPHFITIHSIVFGIFPSGTQWWTVFAIHTHHAVLCLSWTERSSEDVASHWPGQLGSENLRRRSGQTPRPKLRQGRRCPAAEWPQVLQRWETLHFPEILWWHVNQMTRTTAYFELFSSMCLTQSSSPCCRGVSGWFLRGGAPQTPAWSTPPHWPPSVTMSSSVTNVWPCCWEPGMNTQTTWHGQFQFDSLTKVSLNIVLWLSSCQNLDKRSSEKTYMQTGWSGLPSGISVLRETPAKNNILKFDFGQNPKKMQPCDLRNRISSLFPDISD